MNIPLCLILACVAGTLGQIVGYWTWLGGSKSPNARSVYGTLGVPGPNVAPGGRREPLTWVDSKDNIYLYGGYMSLSRLHYHSDMWKYDGKQWAWLSGSNCSTCVDSIYPIYGTLGVASPDNRPGARCCSCTWVDSSNNLYLFGGQSVDASGRLTVLNDLWRFDGVNWTWLGGSNRPGVSGVYGTKGVPSTLNMPGARVDGQCWGDNNGHFWVYGGMGYAGDSTYGELSDMWRFDHSAWTWMNGSSTVNSYISYGQQGVESAGSTPGSRYDSNGWFDSKGNFWLFGGMHNNDEYNDFWRYNTNTTYWTWMTGSQTSDVNSTTGTQGFGGPLNTPGSRAVASSHIDDSDRLWLFGGTLRDSSTWTVKQYNDLWVYKPDTGFWTFVSGSPSPNANASWGIQGQGSAYNVPAARHSAGMWIDSKSNIYIFGGGIGWSWTQTTYNDLWKFTLGNAPPTSTGPSSTSTSGSPSSSTSSTTGRATSTTGGPSISTTTTGQGDSSSNGGLTAGVVLVGINILLFDIAIIAGVVWYFMKKRAGAGANAGHAYNPLSTFYPDEEEHHGGDGDGV